MMNKKLIKRLKDFLSNLTNKTCWRCGKKFYHGFTELCNECEKDLHRTQ